MVTLPFRRIILFFANLWNKLKKSVFFLVYSIVFNITVDMGENNGKQRRYRKANTMVVACLSNRIVDSYCARR